ncbi:MAG: tetratricopeptide repeat protein [Bdellovibrionales bacterium]|nr:tetratricopeptide repeat protein [Bdellovibrionales bacterium]
MILTGVCLLSPAVFLVSAAEKDDIEESFNLEEEDDQKRTIAAKKIRKTKLKTDRSKLPSVKIAPVRKGKKLPLKAIRPPTARVYHEQGTDEAELESVLNEEIAYLFKLIRKNRGGDLLLRLGSLYVDKARLITFKLQTDYDRKMSEFEQGKRKRKPFLNLKTARNYNLKAIRLFDEFKRRYPKSKRMDEVLFFLGFNSYQLDRAEAGAKYFHELEARHPKSPFVYEAHFQLGEHYFKHKNWQQAARYYDQVARRKKGKFYFFALYKLAWSQYKSGYVSRGLGILERIIKEGRIQGDSQRFVFTTEAIEDLTLFYSYSRRSPKEAPSYFHSLLPRKKAEELLKRLAEDYKVMGHTQGVMSLFTYLINRHPLDSRVCENRHHIVQSLYHSAELKQVISAARSWVRNCGQDSAWVETHEGNSDLIRTTHETMEDSLRKYSLKNHHTFRSTKANRSRVLALNFYKMYFSEFEDTKHSDQMHYFYGELLFDSKKYKAAVKKYEEVIRKYPNSKYAITAYTNQILALEKTLPSGKEIEKLIGKRKGVVSLPREIQVFIALSLRYLEKFPKRKNSSSILYRVGTLYYSFGHLDKAAVQLKKLYDRYPSISYISEVGGLLLDIYNRKKDYASLQTLASQFTANKRIDKSLLKEAHSILQQLSFKDAQDLAVQGEHGESAALYEAFAKKNPTSKLTPSSYYNAAINYEKAGDVKKAISMYSAVLAYKNASLKIQKRSKEFLPVLHERLGFYWKAAEGYASYAGKFPKEAKAMSYWYNAGVIYSAFNRIDKAVFSYNQYLKLNRNAGEKSEVLYSLAQLHERNRLWSKAVGYYDRYIKSPSSNRSRQVQAVFQTAEIYQRHLRNPKLASVWYNKVITSYRRWGAGASFAAQAEMRRALKFYSKFQKARIAGAKNQTAAVNKKIQLLQQLDRVLKPVVRYDDGEQIIASLVVVGRANQQMAEAIFRAPLPKGLNKEGRQQYREGIKKIIAPYLTKAVKSYTLALEKSKQFKTYSEWIGKAYRGLRSIQMTKAGEFLGFQLPPVEMEVLNIALLDDTKIMSDTFLGRLNLAIKYQVSQEEKKRIFYAIKSGKERTLLKTVSRILNKDPDNILAINALGLFYLKHKKPQMGVLVMNRVLSKKPDIAPLLNNLGIVFLRQKDVRQAIVWFKKALEADDSDVIANANLGTIFVKQGNFASALPYLTKTYNQAEGVWSKEDKRFIAAFNNYGVALAGVGDWKSAHLLYKGMTKQPAVPSAILLNQAIVLAEGFNDDKFRSEAKGLVDELSLGHKSVRFKRKLDRLLSKLERK